MPITEVDVTPKVSPSTPMRSTPSEDPDTFYNPKKLCPNQKQDAGTRTAPV